MTVYRTVCDRCTAFVKSPASGDYQDNQDFWDAWDIIMEKWDERHVCGVDDGDGVEKEKEFELFVEEEMGEDG